MPYMKIPGLLSTSSKRKRGAGEETDCSLVKKHPRTFTDRLQERMKPCSGRDEMCLTVLNDDWASHPTWASEDSGFVAHRKNIFEEGLHRIEEERHDYDFNIEANAKVIQLLEPFAQQILNMSPAEREEFSLPIALGGSSQAIYRRVLKKIYGERGNEVVVDLFKDPCAVMPIVLARLKAKDEEWRMTQVSVFISFLLASSINIMAARMGESLACADPIHVPEKP